MFTAGFAIHLKGFLKGRNYNLFLEHFVKCNE